MIANVRKVRPKALRRTRSIDLPRQRGQRQFPLRQSFRSGALLVIGEGQTVQHIRTAGRELESMAVIAYRGVSIAALRVVVGESQIACCRGGTLLEKSRKTNLGGTPVPATTIFALSPTRTKTKFA